MILKHNIQKITTGQGEDYTTGCLHLLPFHVKNGKLRKVLLIDVL